MEVDPSYGYSMLSQEGAETLPLSQYLQASLELQVVSLPSIVTDVIFLLWFGGRK